MRARPSKESGSAVFAVVIVLSAGALGGCATLGIYRPGTDEAPEVVTVTLTDSSMDVAPPLVGTGKVGLEIVNGGQLEHGFQIVGPGTDEQSGEFLTTGEHRRLSLKLAPGAFRLFCPDDDHAKRGVSARLTVTEDARWFRR
jgi:hypothetical protein